MIYLIRVLLKMYLLYVKLKFNWASCILSGIPNAHLSPRDQKNLDGVPEQSSKMMSRGLGADKGTQRKGKYDTSLHWLEWVPFSCNQKGFNAKTPSCLFLIFLS